MGSWESWFSFLERVGTSCSAGTLSPGTRHHRELVCSHPCGRGSEAGRGTGHCWGPDRVSASVITHRLITIFDPSLWRGETSSFGGTNSPSYAPLEPHKSHN